MQELAIAVLGDFRVSTDGRELGGFRTRLAQALLIYLACEPGRHRRENLMALLWPGLPQASAQQNLRQNLYFLRQSLPLVAGRDNGDPTPLILADRESLQLNPDALVKVDARRLAALLDLLNPTQAHLTEAAALYHGDFLRDFYLPDSNPFEEWAAEKRESFRRGVLSVLERLTTLALADNDYEGAEGYVRRQLAVDPLRDAAHRHLIEILARSGRRSAALSHFESYSRLLDAELNIAPGAETMALMGAIHAGELARIDQPPRAIRGYELIEELGRGSFGQVFRAYQPAVGRHVALKIIPSRYADDADFIRRFEIEAHTIAQLENPQIVPLYDYWREPGHAYLVMRYLRGGNLATPANRSLEQVARIVDQVAAALHYAHQNGIVHRDVKPANVLLDADGNAYLADFGLARLFRPGEDTLLIESMTGTPEFLSPEQARGEATSPLSDQYSFGLLVYQALIGEQPFKADSLLQLIEMHLHQPLPAARAKRPDVPAAVDAVLARATAKNPADRFADVLDFAQAFRAALKGQPAPLERFRSPAEAVNPYKGLLAFTETDSELFFGREALTSRLVGRLAEPEAARFLAVVGPSGSGKSSLIKAGLVPALRAGAVPGSDKWFVVEMVPGAHPFDELETALLCVAVNPPSSLGEQMQIDERGILRAIKQSLPAPEPAELLLIIDQFEELFTLAADRAASTRFLDGLMTAVCDPHTPLRVIITLRADFYDRPLLHPGLSDLILQQTEVVVPLNTDELVQAIERPAERAGIVVEPELVARLVADVKEQPGALPLLQYTLSELFEGRREGRLMLDSYRQLGGISGALAQRAEAIYIGLDEYCQAATRAVLSRLVTLGEGVEDTRRRVLRQELEALDIGLHHHRTDNPSSPGDNDDHPIDRDPLPIANVIDTYGAARLFSFDRDPLTRGPTVEIAHEALLRAWPRLRHWLEDDRSTLRQSRMLTAATVEWESAGRDDDYLLRGTRLNQLAPLAEGHVPLTGNELEFLEASLAARHIRLAAEEARRQGELATAQRLAETEQQRAGEQALAASRLRRRAALLAGALLVAAVLAVAAILLARESARNATLAAEREHEAIINAELAATREAEAIASARLATSREISLAAANTLSFDPELSILLALQALETSQTQQGEEALHQALQQMRVLASFPTPTTGQTAPQFALSPDGRQVATADATTLTIRDTDSGELLRELLLVEPSSAHFHLAFDERGERLIILSSTNDRTALTIQTWTLAADIETVASATFPLPQDDPAVIAISPDWSLMAVGQGERTVEIWDVLAARRIARLDSFEDIVTDVEFDPTEKLFAVGVRNGAVSLWRTSDLRAGASPPPFATVAIQREAGDAGGLVHFIFIDDRALALGFLGQVEVWDIDQPDRPRYTLVDNALLTRALAVSPDRTRLATSGQDGTAHIYDLATGEPVLTLARHQAPIHAARFGVGSDRLYTLGRDGLFRVWDARPYPLGEKATLTVDRGVFDIQLSPDETQMALGNAAGPASVWDLESGERLFLMAGDIGGVYRVDYDPQGQRVAAVGTDNQIRVFDAATGTLLLQMSGHGANVTAGLFPGTLDVTFSPDGTRLATAGADGLAKVWDAATGRELLTFAGHVDSLHSLAWSPDGQIIATSSDEDDTSILLWSPDTGEIIHRLEGHSFRAWGLAFSPDGALLISGGARGEIKAWDVATGQNLYTVLDESDDIGSITFTPDGQYFFTSGSVPLRLRRVADGDEVMFLSEPLIWATAISRDGRWLYAADVEGSVRVMAVHLDDAMAIAHERLTRWWYPAECLTYLHTEECPPAPAKFAANEPGD